MNLRTIIFLLAAVCLCASTSAFALELTLEQGCSWETPLGTVEGTDTFILNDGGFWVLTCEGEVIMDELISQPMVLHSSFSAPVDVCTTPIGSTFDWQMVLWPTGQARLTCWSIPAGPLFPAPTPEER